MDEKTWLHPEVRVLYEITRAINGGLSQQEALNILLERIVTDMHYRAATIRILDQEYQQLNLKAAYGLSQEYLNKGSVDVNKSGVDQRVVNGEQVVVEKLKHESKFQYTQAAMKEGLASMLAVPLSIFGQVVGVLHLYTAEVHEFRPEEIAFISAIANLGAQAIQRSRLFEVFQHIAQNVNSKS